MEPTDVWVEQIAPEQEDAAFDLLKRFFIEEGFETPINVMRQALTAMLAHPATAVFLAWQDGEAVGVATVRYSPSLEHGLYAEIEDLYVLPQARGQGLARTLVEYCCQWCQAKGCSSVEVCITPEAETAHGLSRFYDRLRFTDTARKLLSRPLGEATR